MVFFFFFKESVFMYSQFIIIYIHTCASVSSLRRCITFAECVYLPQSGSESDKRRAFKKYFCCWMYQFMTCTNTYCTYTSMHIFYLLYVSLIYCQYVVYLHTAQWISHRKKRTFLCCFSRLYVPPFFFFFSLEIMKKN